MVTSLNGMLRVVDRVNGRHATTHPEQLQHGLTRVLCAGQLQEHEKQSFSRIAAEFGQRSAHAQVRMHFNPECRTARLQPPIKFRTHVDAGT